MEVLPVTAAAVVGAEEEETSVVDGVEEDVLEVVAVVVELTTTFLTLPEALAGLLLLATEAEAAADGLALSPFTLAAAASCCLALTLTKATSSMETLGSAHSGRTGRRLTLGQALFLCALFFVQKGKCSPFLELTPTPRQMPRDVTNISED